MQTDETVDGHYYQVARPHTPAERLVIAARDGIYRDFMRLARPAPDSTILDVGVSDVVGAAANVLERKYPYLEKVAAVGLGTAERFCSDFPEIAYQRIQTSARLPFSDKQFDISTSNAVLEHVGSVAAQAALVSEMVRVSHRVFITVPNRHFLVEHHTGLPLLHWLDGPFKLACRLLGKEMWADPRNLILMTRKRLRHVSVSFSAEIGMTGIRLGPLSSNLYLLIG